MNYKEGALCACKNARSLLRAGEVVANSGQFGHATSLTVLSCEEAIKSISYWANYFELPPDFVLFGEGNLHAKRLGTGRIYDIILYLTEKGILDILDYNSLSFNGMIPVFEAIIDSKDDEGVVAVKSWWNSANKLKQNGFYVDIHSDSSVSCPSRISEVQYIDALANAYKVLRIAQFIKVFSLSKRFDEERNNCIAVLKSLIFSIENNSEDFVREITDILVRKGLHK